jgi:hypothetical protein
VSRPNFPRFAAGQLREIVALVSSPDVTRESPACGMARGSLDTLWSAAVYLATEPEFERFVPLFDWAAQRVRSLESGGAL